MAPARETGKRFGEVGQRASIALVWLAIAFLSLWLRSAFPIPAIGFAVDDDALFIKLAENVQSGRWLGPYDQLTLARGMFYPLFIALCHEVRLPLVIGEHLVYVAASGLLAASVARSGRGRLATILFAALAFNPVLWTGPLACVIREALYIGQSVALLGLVVLIIVPAERSNRRPAISSLLLGVVLGLVLGSFFLTREEGIWIVPALATTVGARLVEAFHPSADTLLSRLRAGWTTAAALAVAGVTSGITIGTVMLINNFRYGRERSARHSRRRGRLRDLAPRGISLSASAVSGRSRRSCSARRFSGSCFRSGDGSAPPPRPPSHCSHSAAWLPCSRG